MNSKGHTHSERFVAVFGSGKNEFCISKNNFRNILKTIFLAKNPFLSIFVEERSMKIQNIHFGLVSDN